MKSFLNIIAVMLLTTWAVSFFIFTIGNIAHAILIMAILVAFANLIRVGFYLR